MTKDTTIPAALAGQVGLFDNWFDEIETGVRARVRGFIETMLEEELDEALSRPRYGRRKPEALDSEPVVAGHRHGHRKRTLTGTFGKTDIESWPRLSEQVSANDKWRSAGFETVA